ncbi:MAG: 4,5-DOPA dioxygenase extradiol [Chloroflexota bacterium]
MTQTTRMPAVFFGHGSPMNALTTNSYTEAWRKFGESIPKPRAVLAISAHWYIQATAVTSMNLPSTIHDFYGFPQELYDLKYPAPGDPELAAALKDVVAPIWVGEDRDSWGLDHGTWSVLHHVFPNADVPVIQMSLNMLQSPEYHVEVGRRLNALRDEGVLIMGSGNVVHNLFVRRTDGPDKKYEWASRFDSDVQKFLVEGDTAALANYEEHPDGPLAAPTPDHYLPLLYVAGMRRNDDPVSVLIDGRDMAAISMTAIRVG